MVPAGQHQQIEKLVVGEGGGRLAHSESPISSVLYDRLRELGAAALIEKTDQNAHTLTETGAALGRALKPRDDWAQSWMGVRTGRARSRVDTSGYPGHS